MADPSAHRNGESPQDQPLEKENLPLHGSTRGQPQSVPHGKTHCEKSTLVGRLPLRKVEGRSACCQGFEPDFARGGLHPITGQTTRVGNSGSTGSNDPHGSASTPHRTGRQSPIPGPVGRGEPQPAGSSSAGAATGEAMGDAPDRGIEEGMVIDAGRSPQIPRAPIRVSKAEREAHEVTHVPFRSWCPYCVRGRGRNTPHKNRGGQREGRGVPKVSMDYFFMSSTDEAASKNPLILSLIHI